MASFATLVKDEITKLDYSKVESISLLSAFTHNSSKISENIITYQTENSSIARLLYKEIKRLYKVTPKVSIRKSFTFVKRTIYTITITSKVQDILLDFGMLDQKHKDIILPPEYLYSDEETKRAFIKGLFLATGSINDPKLSRYHLEFMTKNLKFAKLMMNLLNDYDLNSKITNRSNNYMVYVKEAEKIGDFLRIVNCYNAVMYYEDIRIYRDHKNMTNRLNNCEQANVDKIIGSAYSQIKSLDIIKETGSLTLLDEKLQEAADFRRKYPESSLQELSEIITLETGKKITKSGLNHRFRKIKELGIALEKEKE